MFYDFVESEPFLGAGERWEGWQSGFTHLHNCEPTYWEHSLPALILFFCPSLTSETISADLRPWDSLLRS